MCVTSIVTPPSPNNEYTRHTTHNTSEVRNSGTLQILARLPMPRALVAPSLRGEQNRREEEFCACPIDALSPPPLASPPILSLGRRIQ